MTKEQYEDQRASSARVDAVLEPPQAKPLVAAYFDSDGPFAAESFDALGVNDPYAIGTDDLLACTFLDVRYPPLAVRRLLDRDRDTLARLLKEVPPEPYLWEATDGVLPRAKRVWDFLCKNYHGVDAVLAGKLLARKRPRLIPVIDKWVVSTAFPGRDVLGHVARLLA
jgi:hypothetical protein